MSGHARDILVERLEISRNELRLMTESLPEEAWRQRGKEGAWSPGEIVQHLTIVERGVLAWLLRAKPETGALVPEPIGDAAVERVSTPHIRLSSPEQVRPSGDWITGAEVWEKFQAARESTLAYVRQSPIDLRTLRRLHPVLGMMDGYQWLLFLAAHCQRHTRQVREVLAEFAPNR